MQVVILAAGKGTRLQPYTNSTPKPLVSLAGASLIDYTLRALPQSITEINIVIGYLGEQIKKSLGENWHGIPIKYHAQTKLLGTGDAITKVQHHLQQEFLVVNGDDIYTAEDLQTLSQCQWGVLAWPSNTTTEFGLQTDAKQNLIGFNPQSNLVNCGAYKLQKDFFNYPLVEIPVRDSVEYSLPHTLMQLTRAHQIAVIKAKHWLPVGTPEQYQQANAYLENIKK